MTPEDEQELMEYEKQLYERMQRDMEVFIVQVYETIQEDKKRDLTALIDEANIIAEAKRLSAMEQVIGDHERAMEKLQKAYDEYAGLK